MGYNSWAAGCNSPAGFGHLVALPEKLKIINIHIL